MKQSNYINMLSEDGLIEVLKGNIQDISTKTQIPESTLRNYRSGKLYVRIIINMRKYIMLRFILT